MKYISPTSLQLFERDRELFYLQYLAFNRPPRPKQTQPMSIGSAFDAQIKSYITINMGLEGPSLEELFETQVEPHNRDWARIHGEYAFKSYMKSGAVLRLMSELEAATVTPRMEFTAKGESTIMGVPISGKPDLYYINKSGMPVIFDWKVNGYCSKGNTSPRKGYRLCCDGWDSGKHSRSNGLGHADASILTLEEIEPSWSTQTTMYSWMLGNEDRQEFMASIDQLACKGGEYGDIRVASFRNPVSAEFQAKLVERLTTAWEAIKLGTVVSPAQAKVLDDTYKAYEGDSNDPNEQWFRDNF